MWLHNIVTYLHLLSIIGLFVVLFVEALLIKRKMTKVGVVLMGKVDAFYGLLSVAVLITGTLRLLYFGKGLDYYFCNSLFYIKLGLFLLIGLLSIYPSVIFFKLKKCTEDTLVLTNYIILRNLIYTEIILLLCIPFLAVLLANGYNFF
ncbi:MAG: DUF2214 family protein [Crocinitomicaceae bacterium]